MRMSMLEKGTSVIGFHEIASTNSSPENQLGRFFNNCLTRSRLSEAKRHSADFIQMASQGDSMKFMGVDGG